MRAIKIDVVKKEVYEIDLEQGLDAMYKALECEVVDGRRIGSNIYLWIDDEGLLHEPLGAFSLRPGEVFSGHGLVTGISAEGETVDFPYTIGAISGRVTFVPTDQLPEPRMEFIPLGPDPDKPELN